MITLIDLKLISRRFTRNSITTSKIPRHQKKKISLNLKMITKSITMKTKKFLRMRESIKKMEIATMQTQMEKSMKKFKKLILKQ